jgi:predicted permease
MWNEVGTQYFEAVGQPIVAGRGFEEHDDTTATPKIIVTRAFVDRMFPGLPIDDAVGRQVFSWRDERVRRDIVGIAGDVRYDGAADAPTPVVYVPQRQSPRLGGGVIVRGRGSPAEMARAARRELASLDPGIAMANLQTMEDALARSVAPHRFNAMLFGAFALMALLLASIGLYGVLSYSVARDVREIGVRLALGASPGRIRRSVLVRSLSLVVIGAVLGMIGALALTRLLASLLFEVAPTDPGTFLTVTVMLFAVATLAGWVPARRATRIDPALAMRSS